MKNLSEKKENEQEKLLKTQKQFEKSVEQHLRKRIREERTMRKNNTGEKLEENEETNKIINVILTAREDCQNECKRVDSEIQETQALIKEIENKIKETNALWMACFNIEFPDVHLDESDDTHMDHSSSYGDSYSVFSTGYSYSNNSSSENNDLEEILRRDREARWAHDREEELRQRDNDRRWQEERERKEKFDQWKAHREQMQRKSEELKQQKRGLSHQCNTCSLSSKCYMRGSFPCPTYRPR